jgi:tryptophan synthase alpha chain
MEKKMVSIVPYILAGFPNIQVTIDILSELNELPNVEIVELGVPFSDPVADGPIIEKAHKVALQNKITIDSLLTYLSSYSFKYDIYLMSYLNPILSHHRGVNYLIDKMRDANIKGLIIPDLPIRELDNVKIHYPIIPFITPNSKDEDIKYINEILKPSWVYYVMRYGTTGIKEDVPYLEHLAKIRKLVNSRIYAGFGISRQEQIKEIRDIVDGVIIGSLFIKMIDEEPSVAHIRIRKKILELGEV